MFHSIGAFAELHTITNFTFLQGASHPEDLVRRAKDLGLKAIAITDQNSLAGVVRAHAEAKKIEQPIIIGAELVLEDGQRLVALPKDKTAYSRLTRLISAGRRRAEKGACIIKQTDVLEWHQDIIFIFIPPDDFDIDIAEQLAFWRANLNQNLYLFASHLARGDDQERLLKLNALGTEFDIPLVATNHCLMHHPKQRDVADALTCIREHCTLEEAGTRLLKNAERHLKSPQIMRQLFMGHLDAVENSLKIIDQINFNLDELSYMYPSEVSNGKDPHEELVRLIEQELPNRYPTRDFPAQNNLESVPDDVKTKIQHELKIIKQLNYAPYFLTVYDIVKFARSKDILCQGRGSAANSVLCYILGITSVSPDLMDMVFERFVSSARDEPPDIDVDFEHERREEVIQYIYEKYGRHRAGLTATVICYRARSAIREVGKIFGLSDDTISSLASVIWGWSSKGPSSKHLLEAGLNPNEPRLAMALNLAARIMGFPRHLSQHVGGFIITKDRLDELVPIENASMEDRTVIEWDKDDIETLKILKVDVLGLGMLTCIRKAFSLLQTHYGLSHTLASLPEGDTPTYDMLCKGDSIGVFQVESRAQMSFLPRMKPRKFYDLVIEVAIVRPGPIQGDMVHPYIRRRNGEEEVKYPSKELEQVLKRTLGVPLFQEQAMKIAIVGAGFTPDEADGLRRAMATFRKMGTIQHFRDKFIQGMLKNGYDLEFAERCFSQIEGFGEYGFPESHAASFALLVYVSAWLKCHYPAVFACALVNSQPMGFYAPAQIIRDVREHGVDVRPPDVNFSDYDCTLEPGPDGLALRLGLRLIKGVCQEDADWIVATRGNGYVGPRDLWVRANIRPDILKKLAAADAFSSMQHDDQAAHRRNMLWQISAIKAPKPLPLFTHAREDEMALETTINLPAMHIAQDVAEDYRAMRLSLKDHPVRLLRPAFKYAIKAKELAHVKVKSTQNVCGLVLARQRPGTAKGVVFLTLEDETGTANIIVWEKIFERYRRAVMTGRLLRVRGVVEREGSVIHVIAKYIEDLSLCLEGLDDEQFMEHLEHKNSGKTPKPELERPAPTSAMRHPRDQARILFPSRDFH